MEEKERDAAGIENIRVTDTNSETGMDRLKALFTIRYCEELGISMISSMVQH